MGGLLIADTLLEFINTRPDKRCPLWPKIIACIAFDTPARSFLLRQGLFTNTSTVSRIASLCLQEHGYQICQHSSDCRINHIRCLGWIRGEEGCYIRNYFTISRPVSCRRMEEMGRSCCIRCWQRGLGRCGCQWRIL